MGIEVGKTGIDWVDQQLKAELDNLKASKFDKDKSIKHLNTVKNAKSYSDMMKSNPAVTIMAVQILLKELGYASIGKIDGILRTKGQATSRTMEAIKDFQRKNKLTPDGAPGPDTVKKLLEKFGNGSANTPKPAAPNNPKPTTPNNPKPKTPEKTPASPEMMTLNDIKKIDISKLGKFGPNGFVFNQGMEKSDKKGKYIELQIGGKKKRIYERGNNQNGIFYERLNSGKNFLTFAYFKNGQEEGRETYISSKGDKYIGGCKNGLCEGQGTTIFGEGEKYVGQYKNDDFEGQGTFTFTDGNKYVGQFKEGLLFTGQRLNSQGKVVDRCRNGIRENSGPAKRGVDKKHERKGRKR